MNSNCSKFIANLRSFVEDLNRYVPNQGAQKIIQVFDKLKMERIIIRFYQTLKKYETQLKTYDEGLFKDDLVLLPGLNVTTVWTQLTPKRKKKVFAYLNLLYVLSDLIVKSNKDLPDKKSDLNKIEEEVNQSSESQSESESKKDLNFNPYDGVGDETGNEQFSLEHLYSGPETLPGGENSQSSGAVAGLGMLMGGSGLGSLNMNELKNELKNITDEDITEATSGLREMLSANADDKTSNLFSSVIENITAELRTNDLKNGDPFQNIINVAQSIATKMQGKISQEDMTHLMNSTTSMAQKYADDFGVGEHTDNPEKLMEQLFNKMQG